MDQAQAQPGLTDAQLIERADASLRGFLASPMADSLREAIEYAVFSGGKRIRPVLCLRACEAVATSCAYTESAVCGASLRQCDAILNSPYD